MTGSGIISDPYIISNATDLQAMENDLSAYYELGGDIDASATSGWNGNDGFDPVGTSATPFTGNFNGKGYTISDLVVNRATEDFNGLFGKVEGTVTIQKVSLVGGSITGKFYTGALIGQLREGGGSYTINNCHSDLTIIGEYTTGGLIGDVWCSAGTHVITRCYATGDVTDIRSSVCSAGGLIGKTYFADEHLTISLCFATGDVSAADAAGDAGGLIGTCGYEHILNCYARGDVSAGDDAGGLIGSGNPWDMFFSYATGLVTAGDTGGGLASGTGGSETDLFWDTETSGWATSSMGIGKATDEMKTQSTFTDEGWDFDTIWAIIEGKNDGYPVLEGVTLKSVTDSPELESLLFYWYGTPSTINGWVINIEALEADSEALIAEFEAIRDTNILVPFYPTGDPNKTSYNVKLTTMPLRFRVENQTTREGVIQISLQEIFNG